MTLFLSFPGQGDCGLFILGCAGEDLLPLASRRIPVGGEHVITSPY